MTIQRLSLMGVGLLGGSIGLAIRSHSSNCEIMGYGRNAESLKVAKQMGAVTHISTDLAEAVRGAELVVLCTPVGVFEQLLTGIAPALRPGAIVTDVGSTKRTVQRLAEQILPTGIHFVGSHPMAGSEQRGIQAARPDLYQGALCITTPTARTDSPALAKVESFWMELGMRITRLDPQEHDQLLAEVSHLPHVLAAALVAAQSDRSLPLAGKGFMDMTRIAAGDAGLWGDILQDNADNLRISLERLRQLIDRIESLLGPGSREELERFLQSAAQRRRSMSNSQS